ncbi:MAG: hypothetical protein AAB481_05055 [Patescibacteria group bacterium]
MAGCEFNRQLEIDKYIENKEVHGERFARQYLKTNMAHYRAKETGQAVPSWDVYLTDQGLTTTDGEGLLELTGQPLMSHFSGQISSDIKMRVPIEMETVRHANVLAASGADTIFMPEHISENGGIFVRFVTRYKRDSIDPNKYQGSQIDLGKNMSPEEAKNKMRDMMENSHLTQSLQSNTYKDAYAFGTEKARRGDNESLSNQVRHLPIRETTPQHTPVLTDEKVATQNKVYSRNVLGFVVSDVAKVGRSVVAETVTTAIMTGKYLFERERKKTEKKPEETKSPEKIDRFNPLIYKRHTEMRGVKNALVIIRKTDVGVGAIPYLISVLVKELPAPIKAVEKSVRRYEKNVRRKKDKEVRKAKREPEYRRALARSSGETKKDSVKVQPLRSERIEPLRAVKERKVRIKRGREKGIPPGRAAVELLTPIVTEKRRLRKAVEKSMRRHEKRKLRNAKRETKKDSVKVQPLRSDRVEPLKERKRSIQRKERAAVAGLNFAWMVWMLLSTKNESKQTLDPRFRGDDKKRIGNEKEESTPWVLLSIIWYLTAMRESRGAGSRFARQGVQKVYRKKGKKKQHVYTNIIPNQAIIFAYAS